MLLEINFFIYILIFSFLSILTVQWVNLPYVSTIHQSSFSVTSQNKSE